MRAFVRRIRRDSAGASALEFALVAPLFFALVLSTFEAGWLMTKATMVDRAVDITMRKVRLGGTGAPSSQTAIRKSFCDEALVIHDCEAVTTVELREVKSAADIPSDAAVCVTRDAKIQPVVAYRPAQQSMIMFVRVCVVTDALAPMIGLALQIPKDARGGYRFVSTSAFMTEPGA